MLRRMISAVALIALVLSIARAAEDQYFDSDGVKIHYVVEGTGEPVILIHGFSASIPVQWQLPGIFSKLSQEYQVIALDNLSGMPVWLSDGLCRVATGGGFGINRQSLNHWPASWDT